MRAFIHRTCAYTYADVILSTKTMMLMMNAGGTGVAENLNSSSGQVGSTA